MAFEVFHPARSPRIRTRVPAGQRAARNAEIQRAYVAGVSRTELVARYGLSYPRVCQIVSALPGDLAAQIAMGAAYRGDLHQLWATLAALPPEQVREISAAAALLASTVDGLLMAMRAANE